MRYFRLDLLTLLISLFIFSSCQDSENVSLDTNYDQAINGKLTDTSTVFTSTVKEADSVITSGLSQHPFGYFNDPSLGTTEANLAFTLTLPSEAFSFGTAPTLDSAVLVLKYGDELYGDSLNSTYAVKLRQLNENYKSDVSYSSKKEWALGAEIGSKTVRSFPWRDTVAIKQIVDGGADTAKKIVPHLRIRVNSDFINQNFLNAGSTNLATTTAFRNFIKGLYLTLDKSSSTGAGGITFFDLTTTGVSRLEVYYKNTTSTNAIDTNMAAFPISSSLASSNIKHTYTTAVTDKLNKVSDEFYVQGLAGLRGKINLPYLTQLEQNGEIAVNKAELVVSVVGNTDVNFQPAKRVVLYRTDIAGQRQVVPDYSPSVIGAIYDSAKKRYVFNISSYVQSVLNKKLDQYDLYIAPIDYSLGTSSPNIYSSSTVTTAMRSVLGGKGNLTYKVKLNVYYTRPD